MSDTLSSDDGLRSEIRAERERWESTTLKKGLDRIPEANPSYTTVSDMKVHRIYTPEDVSDEAYMEKLGFPGEFPYTRGVQASMYRSKPWTMRQFAGFGSAEETNQRFRYLLEQGQTGLSTAFDLPTLMGYDSDDEQSRGEVGKEGVAIDSIEDMKILFDQIPLEKVTTSMTINAPAITLLAMYVAVARSKGCDLNKIGGTLQNDSFKEFIAQKEWICGPEPHLKLVTDVVEWCTHNLPKWNTISISGYHIREAGATATQELALTIADGLAYVKDGMERGLDVDAFAPRLSFFWDVHNDFLEEIAKFRAARRMWAHYMRDRFGAKSPKSWMLRTHAQTSGVSLVAQQPYNNIVRVAIQALAAVLGGTNSLHTNSMDETYALPTEDAVTIALRTQQIIAEESGVTNVIDPFAGSYAIEALTDKMERDAKEIIQKIDDYGGMVNAIEDGYPQKLISESSFRYQRQLEKNEKVIVGVNKYQMEEDRKIEILKVSEEVERMQVERLSALKAKRDPAQWKACMDRVREACQKNENTFEPILAAVEAHATVGEISEVFREVWGDYQEPAFF